MRISIREVFVLTLLGVALGSGCGKSGSSDQSKTEPPKRVIASAPVILDSDIIARAHWLGKIGIAADTNSAALMKIWSMPESVALESFILDQFSLAPWRLAPGNTNFAVTNPASAILRPLLDDLLQQEFWLEVYAPSNQPAQAALAIKLAPGRAALWQTNLAAALASLTGTQPAYNADGWTIEAPQAGRKAVLLSAPVDTKSLSFSFSHSTDWTTVGYAPGTNLIASHLLAHLPDWQKIVSYRPAKFWLELSADLPRLTMLDGLSPSLFLGLPLANSLILSPIELPRVDLSVTGDGLDVLSRATLNFPKPLEGDLEPWNVPTNLIHDPIASFAAVRGIRPCLESSGIWTNLGLGTPPNQAFFWSLQSQYMLTYCAAPLPGVSNTIATLRDFLLNVANPWMTNNTMGQFQRATVANGVDWTAGNPMIGTFAQAYRDPAQGDFLYAGFGRTDLTNLPTPAFILHDLQIATNLVAYEREYAGPRIGAWKVLGQILRVICYHSQMPFTNPVMNWLTAATDRLGDAKTMVTKTGPDQLAIARASPVGLTSMELHLVGDWLDSPTFPRGFNTFVGQGTLHPVIRHRRSDTNSTTAPH